MVNRFVVSVYTFRALCVDRPLADAAGIRRVDSDAGRHLIGRRDPASYEGLAIPYFLPGESRPREWRLRRDQPDLEYKEGKTRECGKYMSPPSCRNMVYLVPGMSPAEPDQENPMNTYGLMTKGLYLRVLFGP